MSSRADILKQRQAEAGQAEDEARKSRERTLAMRVQHRRMNQQILDNRKTFKPCTRETRRCPEARIMLLDTPECCVKHIRHMVAEVAGRLDRAGVDWWIDYGTLLGYLQFGGLIPWDKDGDFGIHARHREKLLALQNEWNAAGYHATYAPPRPTQRFRTGDRMKVRLSARNHSNVDIFIWEDRPGGILDRRNYIGADLYKGREMPRKWVYPLKRGTWDGIEVSLPAEPELLAAHRYGENWQKPLRVKHPEGVR